MIGFLLRSTVEGTTSTFFSQLFSTVTTPFARLGTQVTSGVGDFFGGFLEAGKLREENKELEKKLAELNNRLIEYERYKGENDHLREFLELKEENLDFDLTPAMVIGRDTGDSFFSFTIDKGTRNDVALGDPVVCDLGLVGMVTDVSYTSAKVSTILDASMKIGVLESATREIGVVNGTVELALQGKTKLTYLPRESAASVGDLVVTSGVGGIVPRELVVGEITAISTEVHGLSLYAEVTPLGDIRTLSNVLVITYFDGQRGEEPKEENS